MAEKIKICLCREHFSTRTDKSATKFSAHIMFSTLVLARPTSSTCTHEILKSKGQIAMRLLMLLILTTPRPLLQCHPQDNPHHTVLLVRLPAKTHTGPEKSAATCAVRSHSWNPFTLLATPKPAVIRKPVLQ